MSSMPNTSSDRQHARTRRLWTWVLLSLVLHAIVFGAWLHIDPTSTAMYPGETSQGVIQVSMVTAVSEATQQQPSPAQKQVVTAKRVPPKPVAPEPIATETPVTAREMAAVTPGNAATSAPSPAASHARAEQFSSILHQAIDRHKQYPLVALRMRLQGTARIRFHLFEDGRVEDVTLLQTSGYQSLDHSALRAVKSIAPFTPAREYLSNDEHFDVDIIFRI